MLLFYNFRVVNFMSILRKLLIYVTTTLGLISVVYAKDNFEQIISKPIKIDTSNAKLSTMSKASTLLISCVDFRLRDETEKLMRINFGLLDDYDEIVMPGASLALVSQDHPHWKQTVEDIVEVLKKLHHIKRVILLDHRDCGAYKLIIGHDHAKNHESETKAHRQVLVQAKSSIESKFPQLKVYSLLLGLDGVVEVIK